MTITPPQNPLKLRTLSLVAVTIFACVGAFSNVQAAGTSSAPVATSEEQSLRERATEYWTARVARDPAVLGFYPPVEAREPGTIVPEGGAIHFKSFEIESVAIDGESARLDVRVETEIRGRKPFAIPDRVRNRTVTERWVKIDGMWFKQTAKTALNAVSEELKTAFERRQAEREAAARAAKAAAKDAEASPPGKRGPQ